MMAPTLARYDPQRRALTRLDQTTYRFAMVLVNVYEAKTQLSKLLEAVERGEKVTIARAGRPIADLVPHQRADIVWGTWKGAVVIPDDFDEPDQEIIDMFEGKYSSDDELLGP